MIKKKGNVDLRPERIPLQELARKSKLFYSAENLTHYTDQRRISKGESDQKSINIPLG